MPKKVYVQGGACCCGSVDRVGDDKEKAFEYGRKRKIFPQDEAELRAEFEKEIQESGDGDGGITEMEIEE